MSGVLDSIPPVFRDRPERPIQELVRDVESDIERAEEILVEAGADGSLISFDGSELGEVEFMLAHLLFVSFNREVAAGRADGIELSSRALDLVQSAALDLPEGPPARRSACPRRAPVSQAGGLPDRGSSAMDSDSRRTS